MPEQLKHYTRPLVLWYFSCELNVHSVLSIHLRSFSSFTYWSIFILILLNELSTGLFIQLLVDV